MDAAESGGVASMVGPAATAVVAVGIGPDWDFPRTIEPHFLHFTGLSAHSAGIRRTNWQPGQVARTDVAIAATSRG